MLRAANDGKPMRSWITLVEWLDERYEPADVPEASWASKHPHAQSTDYELAAVGVKTQTGYMTLDASAQYRRQRLFG